MVFRILIIGCGSIGIRHLKNLNSLKKKMDLIIDVVDPLNLKTPKSYNNKFNNCNDAYYANKYDITFICTPNNLHLEQILIAVKNDSHVFVEKPLCNDVNQASILKNEILSHNKKIMVGCNLRFHDSVKVLKRAINDNYIGNIVYAKAQFAHFLPNWRPNLDYRNFYSSKKNQGGGIYKDAIHEPDYLSWLFGSVNKIEGKLYKISNLQINTDDLASYTLSHETGVRSFVHVDYIRQDKVRECVIVGSKGTLKWLSSGKKPEKTSVKYFSKSKLNWSTLFQTNNFDSNQQYLSEIEYFIDCCVKNTDPFNGFLEAYNLQKSLEKLSG